MNKTIITCTETEVTHGADILEKTDRRMKVAIKGTEVAISLFKNDPYDAVYIGNFGGLEFTSKGD